MSDETTKEFKVDSKDIRNIFAPSGSERLQLEDVIAYVRLRYPNPWQKIILDIDTLPGSPSELTNHNIYIKGVTDNQISEISSINADRVYYPIDINSLNFEDEDYGIPKLRSEFISTYGVEGAVQIMLVGLQSNAEDTHRLSMLYEWARDNNVFYISFPAFTRQTAAKIENGLDISPYCKKIATAKIRSQLTFDMLMETMAEIEKQIDPAKTVIQDLSGERTDIVRLITAYLSLKYNLPPYYTNSFISDYMEFKFNYPYGKLSLFERISFLRKLKPGFGYLSGAARLHCMGVIHDKKDENGNIYQRGKTYPGIHFIFRMLPGNDVELIREPEVYTYFNEALQHEQFYLGAFPKGMTSTNADKMLIRDYRAFFKESSYYFTHRKKEDSTDLVVAASSSDMETDFKLVELFKKCDAKVTSEDDEAGEIFLSIKNSMIVEFKGTQFIMYCPEGCALHANLVSEYFSCADIIITENQFDRLIDIQLEKAIRDFENKSVAHGIATAETNQLAKVTMDIGWRNRRLEAAVDPAIPYEVTLAMHMLPNHSNGLSYYDYNLRCKTNVLPIVTVLDTSMGEVDPLSSMVSIRAIRNDPSSANSINSFGTVSDMNGGTSKLYITYKAFRGKELLT